MEDYFSFLGLPRKIGLDRASLDKVFYELSRKFHPDFAQGKSDKEKLDRLEKSAFLNKAYQTLKDPVSRAEYLLDLEVPGDPKERTKIDPVLVSEIFEIQEMVEEEKRTKDPALTSRLEEAKAEVEGKILARQELLESVFQKWDALNDPGQKKSLARLIRKTIDEITYLKNLIQSIQTGGRIIH